MNLNVDTDTVLLIDAENAFNSINHRVMLHNLEFICPIITTYIINCYATPSRLFIVGGGEILSSEGTTQGDPTAMGAYALGILPIIKFLLEFMNLNEMNAKEVVCAADFSVAGSLNYIKDHWDKLTAIGPEYGYFPKPTKFYMIVKEKNWLKRKTYSLIQEWISELKKRHLSAVIGSTEYPDEYVKDLVKDWDSQLTILSTIAETQPQAAYLAFASRFKSKLNYFLRTIPNIRHLLLPLERTIRNKFIPAVTDATYAVARREY